MDRVGFYPLDSEPCRWIWQWHGMVWWLRV